MSLYMILLVALTGAGAIGCFSFVITYHYKTGGAWRNQEAGVFLMIVYANLGALYALILANQVFGHWYGRQVVTLLLFTAYCFFTWWPLRLLFKYNDRHSKVEGE